MHELKVLTIREVDTLNEQGKRVPMLRVEYMVGDHGPFTLNKQKADFDPVVMRAEMQQFATSIMALK